jgi:hypothetical protein
MARVDHRTDGELKGPYSNPDVEFKLDDLPDVPGLDPKDVRIIALREADNAVPWKQIGMHVGMSGSTASNRYREACRVLGRPRVFVDRQAMMDRLKEANRTLAGTPQVRLEQPPEAGDGAIVLYDRAVSKQDFVDAFSKQAYRVIRAFEHIPDHKMKTLVETKPRDMAVAMGVLLSKRKEMLDQPDEDRQETLDPREIDRLLDRGIELLRRRGLKVTLEAPDEVEGEIVKVGP